MILASMSAYTRGGRWQVREIEGSQGLEIRVVGDPKWIYEVNRASNSSLAYRYGAGIRE